MVIPKGYQVAVRSLWNGRVAVTVREGMLDEHTGRTEPVERIVASGLPCRISFSTVQSTEPEEGAARVVQGVKLYLDPSVDIPEGSRVTVTQNGVTANYERSGRAAVYTDHQEVPLVLWKEWA